MIGSISPVLEIGLSHRAMKMVKAETALLFIIVFLSGCSLFVSDHREKIAFAALYDTHSEMGGLDIETFTAALSAKFPPNSSVTELANFVESLGGKCSQPTNDQLSCTIDQTLTICLATYIDITTKVNNASISSLQVKTRAEGC